MSTFLSPELIISEHYDRLIREVDLHTEQELERFSNDHFLEDFWNISDQQQSFEPATLSISEWDGRISDWLKKFGFRNSSRFLPVRDPETDLSWIKVKDYLNKVRGEIIEVLAKAQQENLDNYQENKNDFRIDPEIMSDPAAQKELKKKLFSNKFCFFLSIKRLPFETKRMAEWFFGLVLVQTDFYVDDQDVEDMHSFEPSFISQLEFSEHVLLKSKRSWPLVPNPDLIFLEISQQKHPNLWRLALANYILGMLIRPGTDIYLVNLTRLQVLEHTSKVKLIKWDQNDLCTLEQQGFHRITHLVIENASYPSMNASRLNPQTLLPSLQFLQIELVKFTQDSFPNLPNLLHLLLDACDFTELSTSWLNSFPSLHALRISQPKGLSTLCTKLAPNLTHLCFWALNNASTDLFSDMSESLRALELMGFFPPERLKHPKLRSLHLDSYCGKKFEGSSVSGLPNLKRLCLVDFSQVNLNFPSLGSLESLEFGSDHDKNWDKTISPVLKPLYGLKYLSLSPDVIEMSEQLLCELPQLVSLEVDVTRISRFDPKLFALTPNLACLKVHTYAHPMFTREAFSYLTHLKELDLKICESTSLESGLFASLASLETLRLEMVRPFSLDSGVFSGLEGLKFLHLASERFSSLSKFDLRVFLPVANLNRLEWAGPSEEMDLSRRNLVDFFVKETQIKTIWYKVFHMDGRLVSRVIDAQMIRNHASNKRKLSLFSFCNEEKHPKYVYFF